MGSPESPKQKSDVGPQPTGGGDWAEARGAAAELPGRDVAWSRENSAGPTDGVWASVQVPVPRFTHLRRLLSTTWG